MFCDRLGSVFGDTLSAFRLPFLAVLLHLPSFTTYFVNGKIILRKSAFSINCVTIARVVLPFVTIRIATTCFLFSFFSLFVRLFRFCHLMQISEIHSSRFDCATNYIFHIELRTDTDEVLATERFLDVIRDDRLSNWFQVGFKFHQFRPAGETY